MSINDLLKQKNMTKYKLSKISGIPFSTISDVSTGKAKIENCAGDTLYRLSKALSVTMEDLLADSMEYRQSFENYKSHICQTLKEMGDLDFIIETLESDEIRNLYKKHWYRESLYLLAMIDYLSRENGLPLCTEYGDIRGTRLREPVYSASVIALCAASQSEQYKKESYDNAIPEFRRVGIIEGEVRNVY